MEEIAHEFVGRRVVIITHGGVLDDVYRLVRHVCTRLLCTWLQDGVHSLNS